MEDKKRFVSDVGEGILADEASWSFGGDIPEKFDMHIKKSIPFYAQGHDLVCKLSDYFVKEGSTCYELGMSTGALTAQLAKRHKNRANVRWVGVDVVPQMVEQARKNVGDIENVDLILDDIVTFPLEKSDFIVSYYTMQFIPPHVRQSMFNKIFDALNWGGAFIMFEKVRACDARFQDIMQTLYVDYKLENNYTPEEIIAKTKSLKGILEPFSREGNLGLLQRAGFVDMMTVFKYICFEGFIAIK